MSLCQYKYSLGKPGEGAHKHVFGFAVVDLLMTIAGAFLIGQVMKRKKEKDILVIFVLLFALGQLMHYLFCVDTAFMRLFRE